jgi:8-oxo-dGTP pyrophosphatase MutT (NUDIX family)
VSAQSGAAAPRERWKRLRMRIFHLWFVFSRPMTFGVRALILDEERHAVFLIRHTYVPGWQLPGGGVEAGETALEALRREIHEECNITVAGAPQLRSMHFNRAASRRDHVALYLVTGFTHHGPRAPDREIAEAQFFPLDRLPANTTPATRRRIAEILDGLAPSEDW